jgi:tetratricopeptide (TPR) repeat protein
MPDDLTMALDHHRRGLLEQAALLYRSVLTKEPNHPDALHLLGVVASQQGDHRRAIEWITRAIVCNPNVAVFHANLAEVYRALNMADRAIASCQTALRLRPNYPEAANSLGLLLLGRGQFSEAANYFRAAVRDQPNFALAHNNLGASLRFAGETEAALAAFRKAVELDPDLAEAHSNLGQMLLESKKPEEALVHCRAAVRLRPNFPEAHGNLGNVLREMGCLAEAKNCYTEALRLNPNLAMLYNNMALAIQEEGLLDSAISWYQRGLQLAPTLACLHCNLAGALSEMDKAKEAVEHYETALRIEPNYPEAHNGLGWLHYEKGRYEEAEQRYRTAIGLKPDLAAAYCNLALVREELNDFEGAERCLREALKHEPRHAGARGQLATMLRGKLPDEDVEAVRTRLADPLLSEGKQAILHFGLGQVLDAHKQYDEAAEHLRKANALTLSVWRKKGQAYNPVAHAWFVEKTMAICNKDFFERVKGFGCDSERPVFIVGLPRSGTTLTEQILASHPQMFGAGELSLGWEAFDQLADDKQESTCLEAMARIDRATVQHLDDWYLDKLRALNAEALRVVDKMPDNYLRLGLLATLFPKAKFIHCRRDLRDIAVSCWITAFRHIRWANEPQDIASRFKEYQRLMEH